jgi:hypothetical protein
LGRKECWDVRDGTEERDGEEDVFVLGVARGVFEG